MAPINAWDFGAIGTYGDLDQSSLQAALDHAAVNGNVPGRKWSSIPPTAGTVAIAAFNIA